MLVAIPSLLGVHAAAGRRLLSAAALDGALALLRAQVSTRATALGADGATWAEFGADTPRFNGTARRLLIGGQRTNSVRNPRAEGAIAGTPGTAPSFWGTDATNRTINGVTVVNGLSLLDLTYAPTAAGNRQLGFDSGTIAAAAGDIWTISAFAQLLSGTGVTVRLDLEFRDALNALVAGGTLSSADVTAADGVLRRLSVTHTAPAGTARISAQLRFSFAGATTMQARYGALQMELGAFASTPVLPPAASRNRLLWSEALENAWWAKGSATIPETARTAPDGAATSRLVNENGASAAVNVATGNLVSVTSGAPHTLTARLKRVNCDWLRVFVGNDNALGSRATAWVNLATGALGTVSASGTWTLGTGHSVTPLGNGWHQLELRFTPNHATLTVWATSASADNSTARANVGGGAGIGCQYEVAGLQVEQGQPATAYQATAGSLGGPAASTRGADLATANFAALFPGGAGTVLWSGMLPQNAGAAAVQTLWQLDDGTLNNRFTLQNAAGGNSIQALRALAGVAATAAAGTITAGTPFRLAAAFTGGRLAVSLDGAAVQAVTGGPTGGLTTLRLGNRADGAAPMQGEAGWLSVLPYAATDAALPGLATSLPL